MEAGLEDHAWTIKELVVLLETQVRSFAA